MALFLAAIAWASPASSMASVESAPTLAPSLAQAETLNAEQLVEKVGPAVVTVYNLTMLEGSLGQESEEQLQGSGTGFVISEDGYIITNWHVVVGGSDYAVALQDGTVVEAELIGLDARDDLAVVKIDPENVSVVVPLADSSTIKPGQDVVAIGSPLGAFTNTVTKGIVSAVGRDDFGQLAGNCQNYSNLIQHDAPINPGNSGGPLFNMQGEVIGVNTLGLPLSPDGTTPIQGLFFAVPSNLANTVSQQLIENGQISAPYIGIVLDPISAAEAQANGLDIPGGVLVEEVTGEPAEEAGLQPDDIIVEFDGTQITDRQSLPNIMLDYLPGDTVELTILRGDDTETLQITLGELPVEVLESCELTP
jgi:2-alkenal reductase